MAITLNDNVFSESNKPFDDKYGPYPLPGTPAPAAGVTAVQHALNSALKHIPVEYRHKGLTVGITESIGTITEYWWRAGIKDSDLIIKSTSGNAVMTSDVTSDVVAGAIGVGQTLKQGSDLQLVVETLLRKEYEPSFAVPTATLTVQTTPAPSATGNNTQVFELGVKLSAVKLTVNYTSNDGGASGAVDLQQDDVNRFSTLSPAPFPHVVVPVTKYDGTVGYLGGAATKNSNFGKAYPNPYATPGVINIVPPTSLVGVYPIFYGTHPGVGNLDGTYSTPTLTSAEVYAGTKQIFESVPSNITVPASGFGPSNANGAAFLWFAVPRINGQRVKLYTHWQRSPLNGANIGKASGDLFNAPVLLTVKSTDKAAAGGTDWTNDFDVYVTSILTGAADKDGYPTVLN